MNAPMLECARTTGLVLGLSRFSLLIGFLFDNPFENIVLVLLLFYQEV